MDTNATSAPPAKKSGLLYWAQRVVEECENASHDFATDPVHDLRVAIRRFSQALRIFKTLLDAKAVKQMRCALKRVMDAAAIVRDLDVGI